VNRLLSVSGLAHGRSGVEVRKSGSAGDPNLLEAAGLQGRLVSSSKLFGYLIQPPRLLSPLGTAMMIAFGGSGWRMPRHSEGGRSIGVSPSPKNSLSMMMGSIIQGATTSRPLPRILIGCGPRGPGMFRAVMTDPGRIRCGCRPGGVKPYPFARGLLIEDAGTERGWRYEGRGPFSIRSDPSRLSQNLCSTNERSVQPPRKAKRYFSLVYFYQRRPALFLLNSIFFYLSNRVI
jgi:hypothetical protein